jgi:hypothetical protein
VAYRADVPGQSRDSRLHTGKCCAYGFEASIYRFESSGHVDGERVMVALELVLRPLQSALALFQSGDLLAEVPKRNSLEFTHVGGKWEGVRDEVEEVGTAED